LPPKAPQPQKPVRTSTGTPGHSRLDSATAAAKPVYAVITIFSSWRRWYGPRPPPGAAIAIRFERVGGDSTRVAARTSSALAAAKRLP
jgi:hypothetical protein